jgi:hypothetical protein
VGGRACAIPPRFGPRIAWIVAAAEREAALRTSGLAECEWLAAKDQEPYPRGAVALLEHLQLIWFKSESTDEN